MKNKRYQINIVLTEEENEIINILRDKYAINISNCAKILLKNHFERLESSQITLRDKTT